VNRRFRAPRRTPSWSARVRLPDVAGAPIAADGCGQVERGRRARRKDEDVAVFVGSPTRALSRADGRRSLPGQPTKALVEAMGARAERAKLEVLVNVGGHVSHHPRSEAHALAVRCRSYAFDVAGPERPTGDLELANDQRSMPEDLALEPVHVKR